VQALPAQIIHVLTLADKALGLGMNDDIEKAWSEIRLAVERQMAEAGFRVQWEDPKESKDRPPSGIRVGQSDGTMKDYIPKQHLARAPLANQEETRRRKSKKKK
jgi:hypothetical protein